MVIVVVMKCKVSLTHRRLFNVKLSVVFKWSSNLPGVATRMTIPLRSLLEIDKKKIEPKN
jgi:hypothetical protein